MFIFPDNYAFMCYFCSKTAREPKEIIEHSCKYHLQPGRKFSMRKKLLDESTGFFHYASTHFDLELNSIATKLHNGYKVYIDAEKKRISFKRPLVTDKVGDSSVPENKTRDNQLSEVVPHDTQTSTLKELQAILPTLVQFLEDIGRSEDFLSSLTAISTGRLSLDNMALHLFLDIGQLLRTPQNMMKYSKTSIDFWTVIQKLFKGKAIRFFKGATSHKEIRGTNACKLNFHCTFLRQIFSAKLSICSKNIQNLGCYSIHLFKQ